MYVICSFADEKEVSLQLFERTPTTYVALIGRNTVFMNTAPSLFRLVRPGLTKAPKTLSIMSVEKPGWYLQLQHYGRAIFLNPLANTRHKHIFVNRATFTEHVDVFKNGSTSFKVVNYPNFFITRVYNRGSIGLANRRPSTDMLKERACFTVNASKTLFCCVVVDCG